MGDYCNGITVYKQSDYSVLPFILYKDCIMLYQAGIKPDYVSLYFLYVYMFVYISITGRYEAGLYQYVLF